MPGFFNQQSKWLAKLQYYNVGVAICMADDLGTNPESSFGEIAPDIFIHLFSAFTIREQTTLNGIFSSAALNIARIGAIYSGMASGSTSLSLAFNVLDVCTHSINTFASLGARLGPNDENGPTPSAPK